MSTRLQRLLARATARETGPWGRLREPRGGVMLHYDASLSDASALEWLLFDPACKVSYTWLFLDDGTIVNVAPKRARAWHAGACRPSSVLQYTDANSAFYGLAVAAKAGDHATPQQWRGVRDVSTGLFAEHRWPVSSVPWRLTDHAAEAWPRGRKVDTGAVLPLARMQRDVAGALAQWSAP